MRITQLQQSGVIITTANGTRIAIDIGSMTPLTDLVDKTVDIMLVSHIHADHFSPDHITALQPKTLCLGVECAAAVSDRTDFISVERLMKVGDVFTVKDVTVEVFSVDHGPNVTSPLAENFGFLITAAEDSLYFAGDMFYPSGLDVSQLDVDVALLPVGTFYTFGPEEAVAFARSFKHVGCVLPMHYEKQPESYDIFHTLAPRAGIATLPTERIKVL